MCHYHLLLECTVVDVCLCVYILASFFFLFNYSICWLKISFRHWFLNATNSVVSDHIPLRPHLLYSCIYLLIINSKSSYCEWSLADHLWNEVCIGLFLNLILIPLLNVIFSVSSRFYLGIFWKVLKTADCNPVLIRYFYKVIGELTIYFNS